MGYGAIRIVTDLLRLILPVTRQDAIVPGSTYLGVAKGDHFAVALPFDKSSDATIKTGMDKTKYPRGALIESLLRFVTDDLAKKKR